MTGVRDCELEVNISRQFKCALVGQIRDLITLRCTVATVEITEAQQAIVCNTYKNTKLQLLKNNFYLVIEVPDHVCVFYAYRLYFADKDIYMIRYFYQKIEIVRVFINSIDIGMGHTRSTKRYNAILY